jgi:hypothetical protein
MPRVGFEPTTPVFQRAKTVHALDRAATVIGKQTATFNKKYLVADRNVNRNVIVGSKVVILLAAAECNSK